jgi:hypothetical protein
MERQPSPVPETPKEFAVFANKAARKHREITDKFCTIVHN